MANRYQRALRRLGHKPWFAAVGRRVVPVDRWLQRTTRGKLTIIGHDVLPQLLLTVIGRKTGQPRTVPLLYARHGDDWVVAASNWGQQTHPAWSANLLANPDATIELNGQTIPVRASLAEGSERAALWSVVTAVWPAYETYSERSGRDIRVFRLVRA